MADHPPIIDIDTLRANPSAGTFDPKTLEMLVQLLVGDQAEKAQERIAVKQRAEQSKAEMRASIESRNAQVAANQARCSHTLPKGETAISGQVHNDGKYHGICVVCQKQFTPRNPRGEELRSITADLA